MSEKYHKIEGVFKRDNETKNVVYGKYKNPIVEQLKDTPWICTEKVDGTNVRIIWDGHNVSFAGRTDKAQFHPTLTDRLEELFGGDAMEDLFEERFGENTAILFGEGYGTKIQKVGHMYRDDVDFIMFDLMVNGRYRSYGEMKEVAEHFNIDSVDGRVYNHLEDAVAHVHGGLRSEVSIKQDMEAEGLVCKPYPNELYDLNGKRVIVKVKAKDIVEMGRYFRERGQSNG